MSGLHLFDKMTIIGLGLIGSSIARAAHERQLIGSIVGCDGNEISLNYARKHGFIDTAMRDLTTAVSGSDLVIIATPPSTLGEIARLIAPKLQEGVILMDTCSVKQPAMDAIARHLPKHVDFVPAHPIAGSEQSGVSAGRADLFERKRIIVTPNEPLSDNVLQKVTTFWRGLGARIEAMPPHLHDMVYAHVSHLPKLLAFAARPLTESSSKDETSSGIRRLAKSDHELWAEIFLLNKENIINALDRYLDVVSHIHGELKQAPNGNGKDANEALARSVLFPRIAASCLITNTMEAERKAGFAFARYTGTGFADFTAAATQPPEKDMERISDHYKAVAPLLAQYIERLKSLRSVIATGTQAQLEKALGN